MDTWNCIFTSNFNGHGDPPTHIIGKSSTRGIRITFDWQEKVGKSEVTMPPLMTSFRYFTLKLRISIAQKVDKIEHRGDPPTHFF